MALKNTGNDVAGTVPLATLALQIAQGQVGQREQPVCSNSGPMVDAYLQSVGLKPGYAWCQAFVHWCYQQAALQLKQQNPVVKTAGVMDCWNKTAVQFKITNAAAQQHSDLVLPGYQILLSYGGGEGHTGLIEKIEGRQLHTIEGNSNNNGSREGFEVVRRMRTLEDKLLLGFIKY